MKIKTISQLKETTSPSIQTSGSVVINTGEGQSIDGQVINPAIVNTTTLNANDVYATNISGQTVSSDRITTNTLSSTSISADSIATNIINASNHSTFSDGITVHGESNFDDINSNNINNAEDIITKNLTVTGIARFFELEIDKIKAVGGSVLLTPADGFKVDKVVEVNNLKTLYWKATDEPVDSTNHPKGVYNTWQVGDQAICREMNLSQYTQHNPYSASGAINKFWWFRVTDVSTDAEEIEIGNEHYWCHYITINTNIGTGVFDCEAGDDVAMLGSTVSGRQSAIYETAYSSLDSGIQAPLIAFYQGINDFQLETHRKSYFDRTSAKIVGDFEVEATGQSLEDYVETLINTPSGVTYAEVTNSNNAPLQTIVLSGNELNQTTNFEPFTNMHVYLYDDQGNKISPSNWDNDNLTPATGHPSDNTSLTVTINGRVFNINTVVRSSDTVTLGTYTLTWNTQNNGINLSISATDSQSNPQITWGSLSSTMQFTIFYDEYLTQTPPPDPYETEFKKYITVNVVAGEEGKDGEMWKLYPWNEMYNIDFPNDKMDYKLRYGVQHILGNTSELLQTVSNTMWLDIYSYTMDGTELGHYEKHNYGGSAGVYAFDIFEGSYTDYSTIATNSRPDYFVIELNNDGNILDKKIVTSIAPSGGYFNVTNGLTQSVQANTSNITSLDGRMTTTETNVSNVTQTATQLNSTVSSHTTQINNLTGEVTILNQQYSEIDQKADRISLSVNEISDGLQHTGIDITNGQIVLDANNAVFTGNIDMQNPDEGLIIYDSYQNPKVSIQNSTLGNLDNYDFGTDKLVKNSATITRSSAGATYTINNITGTLGSFSTGQNLELRNFYIATGLTNNMFSTDIDALSYTYTITCGGTTIATQNGSGTLSGYYWYIPDYTKTNLSVSGTYTINLSFTATLNSASQSQVGQFTGRFTLYSRVIQSQLNKIATDGAVFGSSTDKFSWFGSDQTMLRNGKSAIRLKDGKLERNTYLRGAGYSNIFSDLSSTIPFNIINTQTYTANLDDALIIFSTYTGSGRRTLYLPNPDTCYGKLYYVKNTVGGGLDVKVNGMTNVICPKSSISPVTTHTINNDATIYVCDGNNWLSFA